MKKIENINKKIKDTGLKLVEIKGNNGVFMFEIDKKSDLIRSYQNMNIKTYSLKDLEKPVSKWVLSAKILKGKIRQKYLREYSKYLYFYR